MKKFLDRYFLSDLHLGHQNIIKWGGRPGFTSIQEHDEFIIRRWNETVKPDDQAIILGDFAFNSRYDYLARLHGNITLVLGNHDYPSKIKMIQEARPDIRLAGCIVEGGLIISHVPVHPQQLESRALFNVHGHLHNEVIKDPRYINVCCEQLDYTPTKLRDIFKARGIKYD